MFELDLPEKAEVVKPFSQEELEILSYVEQFFWEHDAKTPGHDVVAEKLRLPVGKVRKAWENPRFREVLISRGVVFDRRIEGVLNPVQVALVNVLINIHDNTSLRQKLQLLKIPITQYNGWLKDPTFQHYLRQRIEDTYKNLDLEAYAGLSKAIVSGDVNAIKFYFEMTGKYSSKVDVNVNIESIVYRVVEIVAKHVKNPEVLANIADDIDTLVSDTSRNTLRAIGA